MCPLGRYGSVLGWVRMSMLVREGGSLLWVFVRLIWRQLLKGACPLVSGWGGQAGRGKGSKGERHDSHVFG